MRIKFIQEFIDIIRGKKRLFAYKDEINKVHKNYSVIKSKLRKKEQKGKKIRVCFLVIYDSVFPAKHIFEKMCDDNVFEPYILVIPDVLRGTQNMFYQMGKTSESLFAQYKQVYNSYDYNKKQFIDFSNKMDLCFFANPYDSMTLEMYRIKTLSRQKILCLYTSYGYVISNWHYSLYTGVEYNSLYKIYALEKYEYDELRKKLSNPNTVKLTGYCKMDDLVKFKPAERIRKKIIVAPHHTVNFEGLTLSNFLKYYIFFLELPKKYPDIDFVFRPHPLLFTAIINNKVWTKEKVEKYLKKMKEIPNVEYQDGGNYFDTFVNSDGLIHDCGSFSAEYLFTGHPCCYLLKDKVMDKKNSNEFHKACIEQHYKARCEQDIIDFIENVVIKENDLIKNQRKEFFEKTLKYNYPNTADYIINNIKKELKI